VVAALHKQMVTHIPVGPAKLVLRRRGAGAQLLMNRKALFRIPA
jgi:hypothetical protein